MNHLGVQLIAPQAGHAAFPVLHQHQGFYNLRTVYRFVTMILMNKFLDYLVSHAVLHSYCASVKLTNEFSFRIIFQILAFYWLFVRMLKILTFHARRRQYVSYQRLHNYYNNHHDMEGSLIGYPGG